MSLSISRGIESVSWQGIQNDEARPGYPKQRTNLPLRLVINSHLDSLFPTRSGDALLSAQFQPKHCDPDVTVPCNYWRLFGEVESLSRRYQAQTDADQQKQQAALALFSEMKANMIAMDAGRCQELRA